MNKFLEHDVERILNVTNCQDHPSNEAYKVFHFFSKEEADYFESLLNEKKISFERDEEFAKEKMMYLFGIHVSDYKKVNKLNYLTIGKYRKPLIKNNFLKWFILLFGFSLLLFALISFFMNK